MPFRSCLPWHRRDWYCAQSYFSGGWHLRPYRSLKCRVCGRRPKCTVHGYSCAELTPKRGTTLLPPPVLSRQLMSQHQSSTHPCRPLRGRQENYTGTQLVPLVFSHPTAACADRTLTLRRPVIGRLGDRTPNTGPRWEHSAPPGRGLWFVNGFEPKPSSWSGLRSWLGRTSRSHASTALVARPRTPPSPTGPIDCP